MMPEASVATEIIVDEMRKILGHFNDYELENKKTKV